MDDLEKLVQELADKRALDELICTSWNAVDAHNWDALRACFTDEVDIKLSESMGNTTDPDEFVESGRIFSIGLNSTMHVVTNFIHAIKGDEATSQAYVIAKHFISDDRGEHELRGGAIYSYESVRTAQGWKARKLMKNNLYAVGDPAMFKVALEKVRARQARG